MLQPLVLDGENLFKNIIELTKNPNSKGVFVFKHSTKCYISSMVYKQLKKEWNLDEDYPFYYLDLISYRGLSNHVATELRVTHESPQILYIRNGECIAHAAHSNISQKNIEHWVHA